MVVDFLDGAATPNPVPDELGQLGRGRLLSQERPT